MKKEQIEAARALVKAADAKTAGEATEDQIKTARAIVATEDARLAKEAKEKEDKPEAPDAKSFAEVTTQLKQMTERVTAAEAAAKKANERADATEKGNRAMRFTEMVKEWPGEKVDNVATLEHLFATNEQGEDSDLFKAQVKTMNAAAAQLKAAGVMFSEIGSSGEHNSMGTAAAEAEAKVKKMCEDGKMTSAQAYSELMKIEPKLYDRIKAEAN